MVTRSRVRPQVVGLGVLFGLVALLAAASLTISAPLAHADHQDASTADKGFTDGWLDGRTVKFFYNKEFFCKEPPTSGATSDCEAGAAAQVAPRPGNIPVLYVMTPLGFRPDASTLQCPEVGSCINHPSTIDVSRLFGPGTENIPLPAHSHIVDVARGGWWEIEVIGVTDPEIWAQIVAGKDLDTVRDLQAAGKGITGDIPTNLYLVFAVQN